MRFEEKMSGASFGKRSRAPFWIITGLVICALVAAVTVFFMRGRLEPKTDEDVIKRVGQHIVLPDETPSVTTVENAGALSSQPFFASVKDGDKILIFQQAARIIIYRPSKNILVNVGPIVDDNATTPSTTTPSE